MKTLTLITEQVLARVPGGTGRYSAEIATALAADPRPGWQLDSVTAWHRHRTPARIPGVRGPRPLPVDPRVLARLWERGWGPHLRGDVVHALTPLFPPVRPGQRLVVTVHDDVPWTHPETLTVRGAAWHRIMIQRAFERADAIVVPTRAVAAGLTAAGLEPAGRLLVIGEGVSITAAPTPVDPSRWGLPTDYLVVVGTLEPRKGLDVLLDAMVALPGRHLAVVGPPGWGGTDLATAATTRGLGDRVHSLGRIPDADLAAVLTGAAVAVLPSRAEGFGLPLLEAMACGVPVVHSAAPALVEVAGGAGVCVPVGDAAALAAGIAAVRDDPAWAQQLRAAGRARAAEFSWAAAARQLWALYADVTG